MNDDVDMRSAFSGWIEDLDVLDHDDAPGSKNDDGACVVVKKSHQGKHGGFRPGAGRTQKTERPWQRSAGEDLTSVPLLERQQQRAAIARAARLERLSKQATQPAGGGSGQTQTMVLLGAGSHADCRENTMMSITDLQKSIVFAAEHVRSLALKGNAGDENISEHMIDKLLTRKNPITSRSAEAAHNSEARSSLRRFTKYAASCLVNAASVQLAGLTNLFYECQTQGTHRLVLVIKRRRYDETPTKIAVQVAGAKANATAKVMQTAMNMTFLLQHKQSGTYMSISTAVPTWLQCVDRTTAEATKATQDAIEATVPELDRLSYLFESSVSLVNTDRYAANFKAERAKKQQQDQYVHNHYGCDVHAAARSVKHLLSKVDGHISGMIAGGLSMTEAGSTRVFRECVSQVLEDRLVIRLGAPTNDCVKHTIAVLNLFLPLPGNLQSATGKCTRTRVKELEKQRATLLFFLNGDISDTTLVEFYTLDWNCGSAADAKEKVLRAMQRFLVPALVPTKAPIFSRKSWTGADRVISYFGILASFHNILYPAVQLFTKQTAEPERPVDLVDMCARELDTDAFGSDAPVLDNGNENQIVDGGHGPSFPSASVTAETVVTGDVDWSEMKRCMKQRFFKWAHLCPRDALVTMQLGALQCFWLLHTLLDRGSIAFELRQRRAFLRTGQRKYMGQEAADGVLLADFQERLWASFQAQPAAFANNSCPWEMQVLHFRFLASAACVVDRVIGIPWSSYPVKMFGKLSGQQDLLQDPPCLLDQLSHHIKSLSDRVSEAELLEVLTVLAADFTMDISQIEAKHASTRRILHMKTVQVALPNLEDVSASWVCRNNVLDREERLQDQGRAGGSNMPNSSTKRMKKSEQTEENTKKSRPSNLWHAWVARFFNDSAGKPYKEFGSMARCSAEFASLGEEAIAELQQEVVEANLRKELGHRAFNQTTKRKQTDSGSGALQILPHVNAGDLEGEVGNQLDTISQQCLAHSRHVVSHEKSDQLELRSYRHDPRTERLFQDMLQFLPDSLAAYSCVPAKSASVDLHLPADSVTQDCFCGVALWCGLIYFSVQSNMVGKR